MEHVRFSVSLRRPARSVLGRLVVRVLIAALVLGLVPLNAEASIPRSPLPDLPPLNEAPAAAPEPICVVVIFAEGASELTETAFGEQIAHTGTDPQPYSFAGEPLDPNSGFQYHRARWMDPRVNRFVGMDPVAGDPLAPATLHKYFYGAADPINNTDPTGMFFTVGEMLIVGAMVSSLATVSSPGGFLRRTVETAVSVVKHYEREFDCCRGPAQAILLMRADFSRYGNFSGSFGPVGLPAAYADVWFGTNPVFVGARIPILTHIRASSPLRPGTPGLPVELISTAVIIDDVSLLSFRFRTVPGHVLYPGQIRFTALHAGAKRLRFMVDVDAKHAGTTETVKYYFAGAGLEDKIWGNLLDNVQLACAGFMP